MNASKWIVRSPNGRPRPSAVRLFCFPYAGGGASSYRSWASTLGPGFDVCAVQLPGRETRISESGFTKLPELVDAMYEALHGWFDVPYAFFGHSMGAKIAFELTYRLYTNGRPMPRCVFFSASRPPHVREPRIRHTMTDERFLAELCSLSPDNDKMAKSPMLFEVFGPTLRADFAMDETYVFEGDYRVDVPVAIFGGETDSDIEEHELAAWKELSAGPCHFEMFPGDHLFFQTCEVSQRELLNAIADFVRCPTRE